MADSSMNESFGSCKSPIRTRTKPCVQLQLDGVDVGEPPPPVPAWDELPAEHRMGALTMLARILANVALTGENIDD